MFKAESSKDNFLEQTKAAREERAQEKRRLTAAITIQAHVKGWLARKTYTQEVLKEFDEVFPENEGKSELQTASHVYQIVRRFLLVWRKHRDRERFEKLCRYLVLSLESDSVKKSYVGVMLNKKHSLAWIAHMKDILMKCCEYLAELKPKLPSDMRAMSLHLHTLVAFTSTGTWRIMLDKHVDALKPAMNQLCSNIVGHLVTKGFYVTLKGVLVKGLGQAKIVLKHASLLALMTLALRPLLLAGFTEILMTMFVIHVLSVPALVLHLQNVVPECVQMLVGHGVLEKSLDLLGSEQNMRIVFNSLEGNYALCLVGNLVHLADIQRDDALRELYYPAFTTVISRLLESIQNYVVSKRSKTTFWNPVLGWFAQSVDYSVYEAMPHVKEQLFLLWSDSMVEGLVSRPLARLAEANHDVESPGFSAGTSGNILRRALEHRSNRTSASKHQRKLGSPECTKVALLCSLYQVALGTMTQLRLDILTGLCYQDRLLYNLWQFLCSLGPNCGLRSFLDLLAVNTKCSAPEFQMLMLFCDCMTHYVTILDDIEMYEQQEPFRLADFVNMSYFLNYFLYRGITTNLLNVKSLNTNPLFQSAHTLHMVLYRRDCRRSYTPDNHWLIKDIRVSTFINDLEKGKKTPQILLQKMPFIIPHEERVRLFRRLVAKEKTVLGLTESACVSLQSTLIMVHRSRIVEDGYRQLALLPSQALKGVIRVRFINEQGLDEAGIDQDGVFKEFLEETIKRVFDPSLNFFRVTSEERLYPSPTSYLQENHLQLFEFVGRMLGKAVYEGIVVDVPFASFFLTQLLGAQHQALYSSIDELPSLDRDLYRSLTFIKHHGSDVRDLDLTFSVDEDCMGSLVTHELVPGGRAVPVTGENKINYIHLMAHFRMNTQIKEQTAAFIRGFRSIVNPDWLSMFSAPELQRLISGDNVPLDLKDLRRHTHYYGGFHDSHRVVCWLWDVLEKDFHEEERRLFLKFVTSCSKPPLLGFAHLEPPFSIRCIEVGDDEDTGDTIGLWWRLALMREWIVPGAEQAA
ncbi:ubiquitin-protein ligase E3B isoform X2 [Bacillus rossius redtenbacheri]|uniref:ubiquitin-protein ligase E3B isoform X2 n=1 Tax=Bacillus rossius redtenbacheri TaxID=93214 RepID=UPI002FDD665B